ncbi:ABC transporter ATP-binding protein [Alicyclobacillus macrosporangiidus]|uniref:Carnitine transport ATP-binding protein OpuCA n=1 Tax=Alicyclobacillus macrosporangiidus TaxID=392015 RepID=A0A1I7LCJ9_9BACL|nr:ABC transporter ATP-binding protein [Alicyclobacillus macrosporangiidus]SFV07410.1 iron(III) transport system ATP-binding protein/putative spermidine/putrescine transport system ATP-binding protein [Alicyclobacillus macrosporangiidus]
MSHLVLESLEKSFNGRKIIHGVSLAVERGELMCFLGPSGCGKTTILNMIAGFHSVDGGEIRLAGRSIGSLPPHKRNMGMVFQNYALFPHLTVYENIAFGLRLRRQPKAVIEEEVRKVLQLTRLTGYERHYPRQLSGGQQQRVAMARALVIRPDVLLLDEPFSNLDAKLRQEMREEVFEIQRAVGITTIFVTHDQEEAMAISDRIAVIHQGVVEQLGPPRVIYERPASEFVATFIGEVNAINGRCSGRVEHGRVRVETVTGQVFIGMCDSSIDSGVDVVLYVRPERMQIHTPGTSLDSTRQSLPGRIERVTFLGARSRYGVRTELGWFTVETVERQTGLTVGEEAVVSWHPDQAFVVRRRSQLEPEREPLSNRVVGARRGVDVGI